jgi:hypothetical protein
LTLAASSFLSAKQRTPYYKNDYEKKNDYEEKKSMSFGIPSRYS